LVVASCIVAAGCGKKGPPLPPFNRTPIAPAGLTADRRGDRVDLQFTVPNANTDNSKPADIERVDVYAFTGPASISDADLVKFGTRIASIQVKRPRDPDDAEAAEAGEAAEGEPPEGPGLDQGAHARVEEQLTEAERTPKPIGTEAHDIAGRPLLPPTLAIPTRTYAAIGISTRGRRGNLSDRVTVPLLPPPAAPPEPTIEYSESAATVRWGASAAKPAAASEQPPVLPSTPIASIPRVAYNVYLITPAPATQSGGPAPSEPGATETKLTPQPIKDQQFVDSKAGLGAERCYAVRAVEMVGTLSLEGARSPVACRLLADVFAPAAPKGLKAVAAEGAISLIWDANSEKDLAGYVVLRGVAPGETLTPLTTTPLTDTTYRDTVEAGIRYVYAIVAVDKAGNQSAPSIKVEETAR